MSIFLLIFFPFPFSFFSFFSLFLSFSLSLTSGEARWIFFQSQTGLPCPSAYWPQKRRNTDLGTGASGFKQGLSQGHHLDIDHIYCQSYVVPSPWVFLNTSFISLDKEDDSFFSVSLLLSSFASKSIKCSFPFSQNVVLIIWIGTRDKDQSFSTWLSGQNWFVGNPAVRPLA